jgi:hypothetical protein
MPRHKVIECPKCSHKIGLYFQTKAVVYHYDDFETAHDLKSSLRTLPHSEVSKLKLFIEIFNAISGDDLKDVKQENFVGELLVTDKFTKEEIELYIKKAIENGQLYERKPGWLAKS